MISDRVWEQLKAALEEAKHSRARWALTLLHEAMTSVQTQYAARGKGNTFEVLKGFLPGASAGLTTYEETAATLGINEAAVNTLIHRLRRQYSIALRREVARTVSGSAAIDDEIHLLFEALVAAEGYLAQ